MRVSSIVFLLTLTPAAWSRSVATAAIQGFQNPANVYRPKFRYWLPDASVSTDVIAQDIANLSSIGMGGFEFLPFYLYGLPQEGLEPPTDWNIYGFGTPAFENVFRAALEAANDTGLLMDFAVGANQGQGVPSVPLTPGLAAELVAGNASVKSGGTFTGPVPPPRLVSPLITSGLGFQHPLEQFGTPNLTAVVALEVLSSHTEISFNPFTGNTTSTIVALNGTSAVDLTSMVLAGNLTWTAPSGTSTWRIFTFWEQFTNQRSCAGGINATNFIGNGSWTVDHFSSLGASRVTDFLDQNLLSDSEVSALLAKVGEYAWEDSMEILAALYWTPGMLQKFEASRGYSLTNYLPLLFSASNVWNSLGAPYSEEYTYGNVTADDTSVWNIDYRTVLNEGYQAYIQHYVEWSHSKGIKYSNQPAYNLPLEMLSDIPLLDAPEGESLGFADVVDAYRQFSGPAHLTGKNMISTEVGAVNIPAYSQTVPNLLYHIKRSFAGGLTTTVIHGSPYSGNYANTTWPGYTTFFYMYTEMWNSVQPCWQHFKDAMDYIARNQYVLRQGVAKVDLAFYLYSDPWTDTVQYESTNLQQMGYTYDYLGPDNFQLSQAVVSQGVLAPTGSAYKALIFSNQTAITVKAAQNISALAQGGLPIFFVGTLPNQTLSASAADEISVQALISDILSMTKNVYRVTSASALPAALAKARILPRTTLQGCGPDVYNVWRSAAATGLEYVYLYNDQHTAISCHANFTVQAGALPYILDAWTGTQSPVSSYNTSSTKPSISIPINLKTNETMILAFQNGSSTTTSTTPQTCNVTSTNKTTHLSTFDLEIEDWHAPTNRLEVRTAITLHHYTNQTLVPWSTGLGLKNVSGVGHYNTTFANPARASPANSNSKWKVTLSLGSPIFHTARAYVNGQVTSPIDPVNPVVDITSLINTANTQAINTLKIDVTTPLFNRIKADANETMVAGQLAGVMQPLYATVLAQEYGLLGPVTINWVAEECS